MMIATSALLVVSLGQGPATSDDDGVNGRAYVGARSVEGGDVDVDMGSIGGRDAAKPSESADEAPNACPEGNDGDEAEAAAERPQTTLGAAGMAGAVMTALGGSGVLAGAALLGANRDVFGEGEEQRVYDYRTSGAIALGVSAAVLVTGAALLVVDRLRHRKRKTTALVVPGPGLGLGVHGRF
jgi:hypothetical protein